MFFLFFFFLIGCGCLVVYSTFLFFCIRFKQSVFNMLFVDIYYDKAWSLLFLFLLFIAQLSFTLFLFFLIFPEWNIHTFLLVPALQFAKYSRTKREKQEKSRDGNKRLYIRLF